MPRHHRIRSAPNFASHNRRVWYCCTYYLGNVSGVTLHTISSTASGAPLKKLRGQTLTFISAAVSSVLCTFHLRHAATYCPQVRASFIRRSSHTTSLYVIHYVIPIRATPVLPRLHVCLENGSKYIQACTVAAEALHGVPPTPRPDVYRVSFYTPPRDAVTYITGTLRSLPELAIDL